MLIFYLFPFFFANLIKRFKKQFEPNQDESWEYLPEHITRTQTLTDEDYQRYVNRFINSLILNAVIGGFIVLLIAFWIAYVRISGTYYMWGLAILLFYYHGAYQGVDYAFYSPESKRKYYGLFSFLIPTIFAFILIANYFDWSIDRESFSASVMTISDKVGLTAYVKRYPEISFGIMFVLLFSLRMFYGVFSNRYRPTTKKRRRQIKEERNAPPKEKPWNKASRESREKDKLTKKEKKKRKKEIKKRGGVFPKKYKGDTK